MTYSVFWSAADDGPCHTRTVQYLADIPEVVRDAFGCDGAHQVVITKEDDDTSRTD